MINTVRRITLLCLYGIAAFQLLVAQTSTIYHYERDNAHVLFFDKRLSQYLPHMMRRYESSLILHHQLWQTDSLHLYKPERPLMMVTDWEDDGNGGVSSIPQNTIFIGMAPLNYSYYVSPSVERYHHLFNHEYTHVVMADKPTTSEVRWRKILGGKFTVDNQHPFSALWSYISAPRWYAPRWFHEGIACFVETWTGGGMGRALGGYDEMNFRALVHDNKRIYSVVGLETDGTTRDFQVGANSYLYGTRFVNYLVYTYGLDKLLAFYNHSEGSKKLFNQQFEQVYGESLRKVWENWIAFEREHQQTNLKTVSEFPLTPLIPVVDKNMGSVSPPVVDEENGFMYVAANYPGDFAHLERIDLRTGKRKRLCTIDGPQLYQASYVALDKRNQRIIFTTQNGNIRGLRVFDLKTNKITKKLNLQRVNNLVYDNVNNQLYGLMSNAGVLHLVRYDADLEKREILNSYPFGQSVLDMDVSHSGKWLTATTIGVNGEQTLLRYEIEKLNKADFSCDTLYVNTDSNLGQFRFSKDDSRMIGSSYYTGVSNIWSLDLKDRELSLLTNTDVGLFSPIEVGDSLIALSFSADGLTPVSLHPTVLKDANAIALLGQRAYEAHPKELESIGQFRTQPRKVEFGDVYHQITEYKPIKSLKFTGAYPELSGFRDKEAWNHVTPVLGYRFQFSDAVGLHTLKMSVGLSPWSHNDLKHQFHADLTWTFWNWTVNAAWNKSDFYDLFGPLQTSRKGWQTSVAYDRKYTLISPFGWNWGAMVAAYGGMDALPMFQNVEVDADINSFQYASAYIGASKMRGTLGSIIREEGWQAQLIGSTYLAGGKLFPALSLTADKGWLLPLQHTSFWLRSALGANFGDRNSAFGNDYFGGFRNNYVDWRQANRYQAINAMPGVGIDAIEAHNFGKLTGELTLPPLRFNNLGLLNFYPTYSSLALFSTVLATNPFQEHSREYYNLGAQVNVELVLFKYLKTTLSAGYARLWEGNTPGSQGQWMLSLKLL